MYAVIKTGGKQYRVEPGKSIKIEKLPQAIGEKVNFENVLLISNEKNHEIGHPFLKGRSVEGVVINQDRSRKVKIVKFRRRKHYMKKANHRQQLTAIKINQIN